ncbi:GntR family transcriptional regulator [Azospirillum sp. SYSU D00513]|uniref:GntR family transcriptional regulator n=1 Tax=Azospirillum sp. SYSU D00513 TaxID=2812561 RepID=UPI001A975BDF|nr:GntR family transcriptional regulator [Azospirillum sp. SYSU D00513]
MSTDLQEESRGRGRREIGEVLSARILEFIRAGNPAPGTHMPAQELAERFNVSRSPVNRALRLLHENGILAHEPNRGYFLAEGWAAAADAFAPRAGDGPGDPYFRIAEDHLHGRLPSPVTETFLRERYGLKRTETADILNRIAREGWAERRPGYGWEFSAMLTTPESLEQTYRLRLALEPAALREPGYRLDPETAARCREAEERLLAGGIETETADALHERGVRFHEAIVGASGNPFFLETIRRINRLRRLLSYRSMLDRSRYYQQCREHLAILDLIERGRMDEAAEALERHLSGTLVNIQRIRPILER